jgi:hypothetical protein
VAGGSPVIVIRSYDRYGSTARWWEIGVEPSSQKNNTVASFAPDSNPLPHSYTHRTRSASPVLHDRSGVILRQKKTIILVPAGN